MPRFQESKGQHLRRQLETLASTSELARLADKLQYRLDQAPADRRTFVDEPNRRPAAPG